MFARALGIGMIVTLAACAPSDEPNLLNIMQPRAAGPDEFAILPSKPLVIPETTALPAPTPGGTNRTDVTPERDAIVALGGNPAALNRSAGQDGALVAYAGRYGTDDNIRAELAAADLEFRRRNDGRLLERLFSVNIYYQVYEPFELDQYAELERLRRAGIRTSSVPPVAPPE